MNFQMNSYISELMKLPSVTITQLERKVIDKRKQIKNRKQNFISLHHSNQLYVTSPYFSKNKQKHIAKYPVQKCSCYQNNQKNSSVNHHHHHCNHYNLKRQKNIHIQRRSYINDPTDLKHQHQTAQNNHQKYLIPNPSKFLLKKNKQLQIKYNNLQENNTCYKSKSRKVRNRVDSTNISFQQFLKLNDLIILKRNNQNHQGVNKWSKKQIINYLKGNLKLSPDQIKQRLKILIGNKCQEYQKLFLQIRQKNGLTKQYSKSSQLNKSQFHSKPKQIKDKNYNNGINLIQKVYNLVSSGKTVPKKIIHKFSSSSVQQFKQSVSNLGEYASKQKVKKKSIILKTIKGIASLIIQSLDNFNQSNQSQTNIKKQIIQNLIKSMNDKIINKYQKQNQSQFDGQDLQYEKENRSSDQINSDERFLSLKTKNQIKNLSKDQKESFSTQFKAKTGKLLKKLRVIKKRNKTNLDSSFQSNSKSVSIDSYDQNQIKQQQKQQIIEKKKSIVRHNRNAIKLLENINKVINDQNIKNNSKSRILKQKIQNNIKLFNKITERVSDLLRENNLQNAIIKPTDSLITIKRKIRLINKFVDQKQILPQSFRDQFAQYVNAYKNCYINLFKQKHKQTQKLLQQSNKKIGQILQNSFIPYNELYHRQLIYYHISKVISNQNKQKNNQLQSIRLIGEVSLKTKQNKYPNDQTKIQKINNKINKLVQISLGDMQVSEIIHSNLQNTSISFNLQNPNKTKKINLLDNPNRIKKIFGYTKVHYPQTFSFLVQSKSQHNQHFLQI